MAHKSSKTARSLLFTAMACLNFHQACAEPTNLDASIVQNRVSDLAQVSQNAKTFNEPLNYSAQNITTNFEVSTFNEDVDFSLSRFKDDFTIRMSKFKKQANFSSSEFVGNANFNGDLFYNKASFTYSKFLKVAMFNNDVYNGLADFYSTHFYGETSFINAEFNGLAQFTNSAFDSKSDFTQANFNQEVNFNYANFYQNAKFTAAVFNNRTSFRNSMFKESVSFRGAQFKGHVSFDQCVFPEYVDFSNISMIENVIDLTSIISLNPNKLIKINLINTNLSKVLISYSNFKLYFPPGTSERDIEITYQHLIDALKAANFNEDYARAREDYSEYLYLRNNHWILNYIDKYWWDYGLKKNRVYEWILGILLVLTVINTFIYDWLQKNAYELEFLEHNNHHPTIKNNRILKYIFNLPLAFIYTTYLFFGGIAGFKREASLFKSSNFLVNLYLILIIACGMISTLFILTSLINSGDIVGYE